MGNFSICSHLELHGSIPRALYAYAHGNIPSNLIELLELWIIQADLLMPDAVFTHIVYSLSANLKLANHIFFEKPFIFRTEHNRRINNFLFFQVFELKKQVLIVS